jgi:Rv2525c-like, glycoside hydrolase-like domain
MSFGLDYAGWGGTISPTAHHAIGSSFACRYLSFDAGKNLTPREAKELQAGGIGIVVVWETVAKRCASGHAGGVSDAHDAATQAAQCGIPKGRPIYFAPADYDAPPGDQGMINSYFQGVMSVLGPAGTGAYLGYWPGKRLLDELGKGAPHYLWQTYAWSDGNVDSRACLLQYSNGHVVAGVDCDYDRSLKPDFGQWGYKAPSPPPTPAKKRGTGTAVAELTLDLQTLKWTVTPKASSTTIEWETGVPRYAAVEIELGLGGDITGKWRSKSLPFNAPPLGG